MKKCPICGKTFTNEALKNCTTDGCKLVDYKPDTLKCPKCGSTAVTIGQRGFSLFTGFIGSSQTMNRCGNCGHRWKPRK